MRVVSVNAWGGAMYDRLVAWLPTVDADIICLQEVTRTPRQSGWATFSDGERTLPQRLNLFADVSSTLIGYTPYFVANDAGPVTDENGVLLQQDFGIATWVRDEIPVMGLDARFVHSQFVDHVEWDIADRPRAALTVTVKDRPTGRVVSVIQMHGLQDPAGKQDTPACIEQAGRLSFIAQSVCARGDVTVLCGDLNLLPTSTTFQILLEHGLVDLVGDTDTRASSYAKPVRSASYMLVSPVDAVHNFTVVTEPEVSDHRPLLLDIAPA